MRKRVALLNEPLGASAYKLQKIGERATFLKRSWIIKKWITDAFERWDIGCCGIDESYSNTHHEKLLEE